MSQTFYYDQHLPKELFFPVDWPPFSEWGSAVLLFMLAAWILDEDLEWKLETSLPVAAHDIGFKVYMILSTMVPWSL